ncbi:FKBP-type peptidyl-prolyl cis-trans isomerase [Streptacidiphilus jiangxiensis]|uniref:FKBP-type peptidyl-prolyl cis-trans isomerase n=1 Tax=Streptacidiphilus jiangxiensis TaxID=235985 RepID=UPI0005A7F483|nr:FKBP-type peptidyl-prolyl cis-trans isomerase [Streptacidiphilus jiangxiensis]
MRRLAAALLLAPALLLTGCGSSTKQQSSADAAATPCPSGSAAAAPMPTPAVVNDDAALPAVSGTFGQSIKITPAKGTPDGKFVVKTLSEGTGATVTKDDVVAFSFAGQNWAGKSFINSYEQGGGATVDNLHTTPMVPMFTQAMVGHKVGSRVEVVAPPGAGFGNAGYPKLGISCHDTLALVFDITEAVPSDAMAQGATLPVSADLPKVDVKAGGPATFTITDAQRDPKNLGVGVLIKGKGPVVKPGQNLIAQYTGATLKDGKVFDFSWKYGGASSFVIGAGQVIPGWDKGLVGQTVGSRVILSIPSAEAYGAQGNQGIPPNANLVFVVDILGAA